MSHSLEDLVLYVPPYLQSMVNGGMLQNVPGQSRLKGLPLKGIEVFFTNMHQFAFWNDMLGAATQLEYARFGRDTCISTIQRIVENNKSSLRTISSSHTCVKASVVDLKDWSDCELLYDVRLHR